MPDIQRTLATLATLLADNATGEISPQDLRDMLQSLRNGHGELFIADGDGAAITISDTTNYFEATASTWTLNSVGHLFDESAGNGRLTYTGVTTVNVQVDAVVSFEGGQNDVYHWRLGVNGTSDSNGESIRKLGTGGDIGPSVCSLMTSLDPGDYVSLWVRDETDTANATPRVASIAATTRLI
jgi:hypothetical protein